MVYDLLDIAFVLEVRKEDCVRGVPFAESFLCLEWGLIGLPVSSQPPSSIPS